MTAMDATALIYNINLSTNQYQALRTTCLPYGIQFPTWNDVDKVTDNLTPTIHSTEVKSTVDMKDLLLDTRDSVIKINFQTDNCYNYTVVRKFGCDGSGSHKVHH